MGQETGQEGQWQQQKKTRSQELVQTTAVTIAEKEMLNAQESHSGWNFLNKYKYIVTKQYDRVKKFLQAEECLY